MPTREFDGELFHATGGKLHVSFAPLQTGDRLEFGSKYNPFFDFYERTRTETVQDGGRIIQLPSLSFLRNVKEGKINCPSLPEIAFNTVRHFQMLSRELIYENIRKEIDLKLPSRQSCLWASESAETATYWANRCGANSIARIHAIGRIFEADAALLMADSEPLSETISRARRYWSGNLSEKPEIELLFEGTIKVLEIQPLTAP